VPGPPTEPAGQATVSSGGPSDFGPGTHFPPTTHHPATGRPALASNRNVLIVAAVVLVIILVIAGIALANGGDGDDRNARKEGATSPATEGKSPSATATSKKPEAGPPAGFRKHEDRSGYTVYVPAGWSGPERKNGGDFFYAPGRKTYLQIDQTDDPGDSAIDDWRRQERGGTGWPGYRKIDIAPTGDQPPVPDTGNGDDSADWEFTFDGDGGRMHILNRGFVTNGHGYAILLRAPDDEWDKVFSDLQPVYTYFKPADD
jgi:hypothetical protein